LKSVRSVLTVIPANPILVVEANNVSLNTKENSPSDEFGAGRTRTVDRRVGSNDSGYQARKKAKNLAVENVA
jgi:hypothetical protein